MPTEPAVRPARPGDARAVEAVARASWHAAYDDLLGAETVGATVDDWYDPGRLAEAVREDDHVLHVAAAGGAVVAFAQAVPDDGDDALARLLRIYARPERWGTGVGTALLARTESLLRERGFERLWLTVLAANDVGVAFYERRGFARVDERDAEFDGERYREYVYEKRL